MLSGARWGSIQEDLGPLGLFQKREALNLAHYQWWCWMASYTKTQEASSKWQNSLNWRFTYKWFKEHLLLGNFADIENHAIQYKEYIVNIWQQQSNMKSSAINHIKPPIFLDLNNRVLKV